MKDLKPAYEIYTFFWKQAKAYSEIKLSDETAWDRFLLECEQFNERHTDNEVLDQLTSELYVATCHFLEGMARKNKNE